jgi:hypothetical protein
VKCLLACLGWSLFFSAGVSAQVVTPPMDKLAFEQGVKFPEPFQLLTGTSIPVSYVRKLPVPPSTGWAAPKPKDPEWYEYQVTHLDNIVPAELKNKVKSCSVQAERTSGKALTIPRASFHAFMLRCLDETGEFVAQADIDGIVFYEDGKEGIPRTRLRKGAQALVTLRKEAGLYPANFFVGN